VNFFASHYGFNLCDIHFGIGKQMVRQQHHHKLIKNAEDIWKLSQKISNTTVVVLEEISDRTRSSHFFTFHEGGSHNIRTFIFYPIKLYFVEKIQMLKSGLKLKFVNKIAVY
jgi:hypothetical protein